jgi:hypothetical protein
VGQVCPCPCACSLRFIQTLALEITNVLAPLREARASSALFASLREAIEVELHTEETYAETTTSEMTETRGEQAENSRSQQSTQTAEESDCTVETGGMEARERGCGDDAESSVRTGQSGAQMAAVGAGSTMQSTSRKRPQPGRTDTASSHHETERGKDARRTGQRGHEREGAARHSIPVSIGAAASSEAAYHADGGEDVTRPRMHTSLARQQSTNHYELVE